jgi:ubiquinone/menaquinone biosynthesis C-methylase UbiE
MKGVTMNLKDKMVDFRRVDKSKYPELEGYSDKQVYENMIGCGGLYLATKMLRQMNIKKGDIILDLGCGLGTTSLYLARNFDITVIAVDFWNSPEVLIKKASSEGIQNRIIPLQIDITKGIPFAENYFDAIFCLNSLFMFGEKAEFLKNLLKTLKVGGTLCLGSECFNKEPDYKSVADVPKVYNFEYDWGVWEECFSKYHSPQWWSSLLTGTDMLSVTYCQETDDGAILWEDSALNYNDYYSNIISLGAMIPQERLADMALYGRQNDIHTTLFVLAGTKLL